MLRADVLVRRFPSLGKGVVSRVKVFAIALSPRKTRNLFHTTSFEVPIERVLERKGRFSSPKEDVCG